MHESLLLIKCPAMHCTSQTPPCAGPHCFVSCHFYSVRRPCCLPVCKTKLGLGQGCTGTGPGFTNPLMPGPMQMLMGLNELSYSRPLCALSDISPVLSQTAYFTPKFKFRFLEPIKWLKNWPLPKLKVWYIKSGAGNVF
jgi:hypothetical protein